MLSSEEQALLRLEIFHDLELFIESRGGFASRDELTTFTLRSGMRMPVIDRNKGIRNPAEFDATLSIVSASDKGRYNVYDDAIDRERGLLFYSWAQGPLNAGDNRKLNVAFEQQAPIILFEKPLANVYVPVIGVRVIDVLPDQRQFVIDLDDSGVRASPTTTLDKRYVERLVRQRVHQPVFRARVLSAYGKRCAICTLKYAELLDAAHILPDSDERGLPVVTNGMAMCTIHHRAYDQNFLGVSPDYTVHINERLLADRDGPMLQYGLQAMDGKRLELPSRRDDAPDREFLAERYTVFSAS
ncbi:MAG: HNH endonuclease [Actinobacteria bacterium]|nr:HNH endonuclease [Actinomycetota bacterium]MBU1609623.1 HNH endonuclease [Actinomycetota bacterium]MBU2315458.1 HNH endonuclease [Actinomycetota bacterium]MBU2384688.1 HNH endonuclease [Actinomycetota bacterium]